MPQAKYRLFCRASGMYYQQDTTTGEQVSLRTKDKRAAQEKLRAANESLAQPQLNLDLARIYLRAHDSAISQRTWAEVMAAYSERGRNSSRKRCHRAFAGEDFGHIRNLLLINTKAEDLLRVLTSGKISPSGSSARVKVKADKPLTKEMCTAECRRLLAAGLTLAVARGRGRTAGVQPELGRRCASPAPASDGM